MITKLYKKNLGKIVLPNKICHLRTCNFCVFLLIPRSFPWNSIRISDIYSTWTNRQQKTFPFYVRLLCTIFWTSHYLSYYQRYNIVNICVGYSHLCCYRDNPNVTAGYSDLLYFVSPILWCRHQFLYISCVEGEASWTWTQEFLPG